MRASQPGYRNLVILPNSVVGSARFTLQLLVTDGRSTGNARVDVRANVPPIGGATAVSPRNGTQFNTTFVFTQAGWSDPDTPLSYGYDYRTLDAGESTDCSASAADWTPLAGALAQPKHSDDKLPAGEVIVRGYASDVLGARSCTFVQLTVLPPQTSASTASVVSSVLDSVVSGAAQGQGGTVQAISLLASMLNTPSVETAPVAAAGAELQPYAPPPPAAPPLAGDALAEQEELRERMIGMLEGAVSSGWCAVGGEQGWCAVGGTQWVVSSGW